MKSLGVLVQKYWQVGVALVAGFLLVFGLGLEWQNWQKRREDKTEEGSQVYKKVVFEIVGAVMKPGVYELLEGVRWKDGLIEAGGLAFEADRDWVEKHWNLAEEIEDGEKVFVPFVGQDLGQDEPMEEKVLGEEVVDINRAGVRELESLSGVGPALAERIVEYRERVGGFKSVEELKLVRGIGEKVFGDLKDRVGI